MAFALRRACRKRNALRNVSLPLTGSSPPVSPKIVNDVLRMEGLESSGSSIIPVSRPQNAGFYFRRTRYLRGFGPRLFGESPHLCSSAETAPNELEFTYLYPEPRLRRPTRKWIIVFVEADTFGMRILWVDGIRS